MKSSYLDTDIYFKYVNSNITNEFFTISVGHERCNNNKVRQGPYIKNHFIIHYCTKGKGYYTINNKTYTIKKDDIFFIPSNEKISYIQDENNPWEYFWFEYSGALANQINNQALFTIQKPFYSNTNPYLPKILSEMIESLNDISDDLISNAYIYLFFSKIIQDRNPKPSINTSSKEFLIKKVLNYISDSYITNDLSLNTLSNHFHLNDSYLSRTFREIAGVSLTRYLRDFRMQKACNLLLKRKDLNIKSIAYSVGYSDPLYFSKEFKKCFGVSPKLYEHNSKVT